MQRKNQRTEKKAPHQPVLATVVDLDKLQRRVKTLTGVISTEAFDRELPKVDQEDQEEEIQVGN